MRAEIRPHVDPLVNRNRLADRHNAERDHTVNVAVHSLDLVGLIQAADVKLFPEFLSGVALYIARIGAVTDVHDYFSFSAIKYSRNSV